MGATLILLLVVLMVLGLPVTFSILLSGIGFIKLTGLTNMTMIPQRLVAGMSVYSYIAIPLFTLSGYLMESGGLSKRLVTWVEQVVGGVWGSMGTVTIICCAIFAALTGSAFATVIAIGSLMIPAMRKAGYSDEASAGILASAGCLGPIIPPSICMIVYATTMSVSITKMFIGGVLPGILIAVVFIIINIVYAVKNGLKPTKEKHSFTEIAKSTWNALGVLLLPIIVLGGIYGGVFTATEAGAICVVYSVVLGLLYRELTFKSFLDALKKTVELSAMVVLIAGSAAIFGWVLSAAQIPAKIANSLIPILKTKEAFLVVLMLILFFIGCLMETCASIVILAPILCPIGIQFGIDSVHLGVIFCIALCVGFLTPPFGNNLFCASAISGVKFTGVLKGCLPYLIAMIGIVFVLAFIPEIVLLLPNMM